MNTWLLTLVGVSLIFLGIWETFIAVLHPRAVTGPVQTPMASGADQLVVDYRVRMGRHLHEKQIALTEEDQYGTDRIEILLQQHGSTDVRGLVKAFEASLDEFRNGRKAFGDTTLLVVQLI